jgi:hypothetical protein
VAGSQGVGAGLSARRVTTEVLRACTVAAVLLSADVHLELWMEGFRQIPVIGPLFLLDVAGGLVVALAVLLWRHWLPALTAAGFGAATLGAFLLSVTVGLFGLKEVFTGTAQMVAAVAEAVAICCGIGLAVLSSGRHLAGG